MHVVHQSGPFYPYDGIDDLYRGHVSLLRPERCNIIRHPRAISWHSLLALAGASAVSTATALVLTLRDRLASTTVLISARRDCSPHRSSCAERKLALPVSPDVTVFIH